MAQYPQYQQPNYPPPSSGSSSMKIILIVGAVVGVFALMGCVLLAVLAFPALQQGRTAARRVQSQNNLKEIGLAMHNYHDTYNTLPPGGIYDEQGRGHHSWQYSLLPFVEQGPLFEQIDRDSPWDSPINQGYYQTQIPVYQVQGDDLTTNGEGYALSHYAANEHVYYQNSMMRIRDFTDGVTNTMLAGEVQGNYKPWGDPSNYRDPTIVGIGTGPDSFGRENAGGANILMGDGSVRFISSDIDPSVLQAISTPNGGEQVGGY